MNEVNHSRVLSSFGGWMIVDNKMKLILKSKEPKG